MIRLAWRQFRSEATVAIGVLAVVAVVLAITGPHLETVFRTAPNQLVNTFHGLQTALAGLLLVVPALVGMFFGAPLVARELETGTFRLAWTQSATRIRWLAVKLGLVGLASSVVAGGLSLMVAWWANPIDIENANRFSPSNFDILGIVPFGYALFAFALGSTTGLVFRRTLPAVATTLAGYVGLRFLVTYWVRPRFEGPLHFSSPLTASSGFEIVRTNTGGLCRRAASRHSERLGPLREGRRQRRTFTNECLLDESMPRYWRTDPRGRPRRRWSPYSARFRRGLSDVHRQSCESVPRAHHVSARQPILALSGL